MTIVAEPTVVNVSSVARNRPMTDFVERVAFQSQVRGQAHLTLISSFCYLTVGPDHLMKGEPEMTNDGRLRFELLEPIDFGDVVDVEIHLDPKHDEFPAVGQRNVRMWIDVEVRDEAGSEFRACRIQVTLGEILKRKKPYPGVVAIDFGTTNSCIAAAMDVRSIKPLALEAAHGGGRFEIASLAYYESVANRHKPVVAIGSTAQANATTFGRAGHLVRSAKRYLGKHRTFEVGTGADGETAAYRAEEVCAHIVEQLKIFAERELDDREPIRLVCTYPTAFEASQVDALKRIYHRVQREIFKEYPGVTPYRLLLDEATAAAMYYISQKFRGLSVFKQIAGDKATLLCYDLGGGTTDISLLEIAIQDGGKLRGRVLGRDGLHFFGGDNMTLILFRMIKVALAERIAAIILADGVSQWPPGVEEEEVRSAAETVRESSQAIRAWLEHGDPHEPDNAVGFMGSPGTALSEDVQRAVDMIVQTKYEPTRAYTGRQRMFRRNVFREAWNWAERAKLQWSDDCKHEGNDGVRIKLDFFGELLDAYGLVGHPDLSVEIPGEAYCSHMDPYLDASFARALTVVREARQQMITFFILAGNACRMPYVERRFHESLRDVGAASTNVLFDPDNAKLAVAHGACLVATILESTGDDAVWQFELPTAECTEFIGGRKASAVDWGGGDQQIKAWFSPGKALPAAARIERPDTQTRIDVMSVRREGEAPRTVGRFDLTNPKGVVAPDGVSRALGPVLSDEGVKKRVAQVRDQNKGSVVVLTEDQRMFLFDGTSWHRLFRPRREIPVESDPFNGKQ